MTQEQFEKLKEYEQELRWAGMQNFLSMANGRFKELMALYTEIYGESLNKAQMTCSTCRLRAVKRLWTSYNEYAQQAAQEQKKKRVGRPKKINLDAEK